MGTMIDQIDALKDAQMDLENVYSYANKYLNLVNKNLNKPDGNWRTILKWSAKVADNCVLEEEKQMKRVRQLGELQT